MGNPFEGWEIVKGHPLYTYVGPDGYTLGRFANPEDARKFLAMAKAFPLIVEALRKFEEGVEPECGEPMCEECAPYRQCRVALAAAEEVERMP